MKITGTKKLLIILLSLMCVFAVSLGVVISRSGVSHASDTSYDESVDDATAYEDDGDISGEENIPMDGTLSSDEDISGDEEDTSENVYDEEYDESVIRSIADILNLKYELVSFYCHANDLDVNSILDNLIEEQRRVALAASRDGSFIYDREKDGELTQEMIEESQKVESDDAYYERDGIRQDIMLFCEEYVGGKISLTQEDEDEDWFVAPDDISSYAYTWYMAKYTVNSKTSGQGYVVIYKGKGSSWTNITSEVTGGDVIVPSGNARYLSVYNTTTRTYTYRDYYNNIDLVSSASNYYSSLYLQVGFHAIIELEPGEGLKLTYYMATTSSSTCRITYAHYGSGGVTSSLASSASSHIEKVYWYGGNTPNAGLTSEVYVDGDAPTGSVFYIGRNKPVDVSNNGAYYNIISWHSSAANNATGTSTSLTSAPNITGSNKSSQTWTFWVEIKRKDPPKPELINHDSGSTTSRTAIYEGSPIQLIANPDYGASLMTWSASTNAAFTQNDTSVTMFSRSQHGVEVTPSNIVLQSSAKGTHYVRFTSLTGKWSDGTTTPVTYTLTVQEQFVERPELKYEAGVTSNRLSKIVNYTGKPQTITFTNVNKDLVGYTAAGLDEVSTSPNEFVFQQTKQGKFTINIFIKNPSGCSWKTYNNTDNLQFTFQIKEMLIEQPKMKSCSDGAETTSNSMSIDYDGYDKELVLAPALEEQLIVIAAGIETTFEKRDGVDCCVFKVTNSGTHNITIMPNDGYLWKDQGGSNTTLSFKIIIKAQKVDFPVLKAGQDGIQPDGESVKITFSPEPTWPGAFLIIENIPKDAIICTYAMDYVSWLPAEDKQVPGKSENEYKDNERTVLTLKATRAITFVVTFALANSNYEWKNPNASVPQFTLEILKYELLAPKIAEDLTQEGYTSYSEENGYYSPKYGYANIEGATKTIYWNNSTEISQLWTLHDDKASGFVNFDKTYTYRFFDLFVGGFMRGVGGLGESQIEIRIFKDSNATDMLHEVWSYTGSVDYSGLNALMTFWALEAGNYIINITPTDNYIWKIDPNDSTYTDVKNKDIYKNIAGTNNMVTFKFEVVPVFQDTLTMFSKYYDSTSWSPEGQSGEAEYDGHQKEIRIGDENNATRYYLPDTMSWALVDNQTLQPITIDPNKFSMSYNASAHALEGWVVDAGTYTIRIQLGKWSSDGKTFTPSENYAWRDGKGYAIYYTYTVKAQSLGAPSILAGECGGGENRMVYDKQNFMVAGYDGGNIMLAINVKMYDPNGTGNIISVIDTFLRTETDKGYIPTRPEDCKGDHIFWQLDWGDNIDGTTQRLMVVAVNVGIYTVRLLIENENYRWDNDSLFYDFQLIIDYANVDDVLFYYDTVEEANLIGGNNSVYPVTYDPDKTHHIIVTRSSEQFKDTKFENQFEFVVSYIKSGYELIDSTYYADCLVLDFQDANTYYIDIYLTSNFRWKSAYGLVGLALRLTFRVNPRQVNIPVIVDEQEAEGAPSIDPAERIKTITYDSNSTRSIMIDLGADYSAYKVDYTQTSTFLYEDLSVSAIDSHMMRFTALRAGTASSAGTYSLVLTLYDDNNYVWFAAESVTYTLKVLPRAINIPNAYIVLQDDLDDPHKDYTKVQSGAISKQLELDTNDNVYRVVNDSYYDGKYNGKLQYIYLFGYAVENSEVTISVTPSDPSNSEGMGQNNISVSGIMRGSYVYAKLVNTYTITLEFKLSAEFGTPNCHWGGTLDVQPRVFELDIQKLGLKLPELNADPTQAWVNDSLTYHITYTGAIYNDPFVIDNCMSSSPINFMSYWYNKSRTKYYHDDVNNSLDFYITGIATVGTEYKLVISIDTANEYWIDPNDATDLTDIANKEIYIVIDKLGVNAPNILVEGDGAVYNGNTKTFTYNGGTWPSALKIENIVYDRMGYNTSSAYMPMPTKSSTGVLITGSSTPNTGTYSLIFALNDKNNVKWNGTANDSSDLVFSLIIDPERIAKPVLDPTNTDYNTSDSPTMTDTDLEVTYWKGADNVGIKQYIVILNYVNSTQKMSYQIISAKGFADSSVGSNTLRFGAEDVGTYQVKITPSQNVGWDDGTEDPIVFTLKINKKVYATPVIVDPGAPATINAQTLTVTYVLDSYQSFTIKGVDNNIVDFIGTESSLGEDELDRELIFKGTSGTDNNEYTFEAKKVGTYKVTFKLVNPDNEALDFSLTADYITFTYIIKKLDLAAPAFDLDAGLLLKDEKVTANTFTAVYDSQRHGVLILNVLEGSYMNYAPANSIYDKNSGTSRDLFFYGDPVASTSITDTVGSVFNASGVSTKFDGSFIDPLSSVSNQLNRKNFILVHAVEPGTYELIFSLTDKANTQWADGSTGNKTVKVVINKKQIAAPDYNNGTTQKPYTGKPVTFELKNIFGVQANNYVDNLGNPAARGYEYEIFEISSQPDITSTITAESLNVDTHVLTLTAVNIGTYKVKIKIKETEHTVWTNSATATSREFTFIITKSGIAPKIEFVDPVLEDGSPDTTTATAFAAGNYVWPKSTKVSAKITFPNLSAAGGKIIIDDSLGLEAYYVNTSAPKVKLSHNYQITPYYDANDLFTGTLPTAAGTYPSSNPQWSLVVTGSGSNLVYNLVYTFKIEYDTNVHAEYGFIPQGKYALHIDQNGASGTYEVASVSTVFEIEADRAPFATNNIEDHIVWQIYLLSDPDNLAKTRSFALSDIFGTPSTKKWKDMTSAQAVVLDFLEDNDSYGVRFILDSIGMNGETDVRSALQSWEVDWSGTYSGNTTAKYAGSYKVSVTIKALDAKAYSYPTTKFTFYYQISKMTYDLDSLVWDYTTPFTYDGTTKTVELKGTLPAGLSIASYDITGYNPNSQIAAGNYITSVKFKSSNPNYQVPDVSKPSSYRSTIFQWTVNWTINKADITASWDYKVEAGETATMSIPRLNKHGEKVEYIYYKNNGDPNPDNWDIVDTFDNIVETKYRVVVKLKSDSSNTLFDYANNYNLKVSGGDTDHSLIFTMPEGKFINVQVDIDGKEQHGGNPDTSVTGNIHKYTIVGTKAKVYSATVTLVGAVGVLTDNNLAITYYNTSNTLKPINAPSEPGHYLVKVKLVNINTSTDSNQYVLPVTEFYFDIEKGDFNKDDVYWRYTHTDSNGAVTVARYNEKWEIWEIESYIDSAGNPDPNQVGVSIPSFVYDGSAHVVELWSEDPNLMISTKNKAQINAGEFTAENGKIATATFSYSGKHWNSPTEGANPVIPITAFKWKIEKAVIDISELQWDYSEDYTYTVSGGEAQKFTVKMDDNTVPALLRTFVEYRTYDLDDLSNGGKPAELSTSILARAGHYKTEFVYDAFEEDATLKQNYVIGDWPDDVDKALEWEIAVREISVPVSDGSIWTVFDANEYDLLSLLDLDDDWQEYFTITIEYAKSGSTSFADYSQMGIDEYGSETFAGHAGQYRYTFAIVNGLNSQTQTNVVFVLADNTKSTTEQQTTVEIKKATMTVENWIGDDEWSKVTLSGAYVSNDFVDYYFEDMAGKRVPINEVVVSSNTMYKMYVFVRDEYKNDIDLVAASGQYLYHTITTLSVSNDPEQQTPVQRVPYIGGYKRADGFIHEFSYAEWQEMMKADTNFDLSKKIEATGEIDWFYYLGTNTDAPDYNPDEDTMTAEDYIRVAVFKSQVRVSLPYTGETRTFVINDWDSGITYSQYLDIWQGNLTQTEAGDYSVTIMFKKSTALDPFCWAYLDENGQLTEVNRDTITFNFRIAFNMIPLPKIDESIFPTYSYTGDTQNILVIAWGSEKAFDDWTTQYGEYFDIIGATGTNAGGYTLQLKIKDIYLNTVHWDTGNAKGQPGTYTVKWKIYPIYLVIPTTVFGAEISYSGSAHSVFELFEGYDNGNLSAELKKLMQLAKISGDSGINAGPYEARFVLPDTNYAWKTAMGVISNDLLQTLPWAIQKKKLDMSQIKWNYDESNPFQYTIENGDVQDHTLLLKGLPQELEEYVTYITDKQLGSTRSLMGSYTTIVYFFQDNIEYENYSLENEPRDFLNAYPDPAGVGYAAITWQIVEHRFTIPQNKAIVFDGTVHELVETLGLPVGWENYLEATVKFKPLNAADSEYVSYSDMVENDALLGYSPFRAFYLGNYQVELAIKSGLNAVSTCVVWMNGTQKITSEQSAVLTINPLTIHITGWNDNSATGDYNITIQSAEYSALSSESKEIFEYIILDEATGLPVSVDDIVSRGAGLMYTIEFAIKEGNGYALSTGIEIECVGEGVTNPHLFGNFSFPGGENGKKSQGGKDSAVLWLPIPTITYIGNRTGYDDNGKMIIKSETVSGKMVYNGYDRVYRINNWNSYWVTESFKGTMLADYGVEINADYFIEALGITADWLKIEETVTQDEDGNSSVTSTQGYIVVPKAGNSVVTLRFIPNLNISWYDADKYSYSNGNIYDISGGGNRLVSDTELKGLIDRLAKKLEISIEKAELDHITPDMLELLASMIPDFDYTGEDYDLRTRKETKALFDYLTSKYGNLLDFEGCVGRAADEYTLVIKLKDSASSYWNLKITETIDVNDKSNAEFYDPAYQLLWVKKYVPDGTDSGTKVTWNVKYVKLDDNGDYVGTDGKRYSDYNEGNYKLNIEYLTDKAIDRYVQVMDTEYVPVEQFLDDEGNIVITDNYKYIVNEKGELVRYTRVDDGSYIENSAGGYIARYVYREGGLLNADGTLNVSEDELYMYNVDANGIAVRYSLNAARNGYVENPNGEFILKYKTNADGSLVETMLQVDGRNVVDTEKSKVRITRTMTSTTKTYEVKWYIVGSKLSAPTLNEKVTLTFTGSEQSAVKVLWGYNSQFMEIVEGGSGIKADHYTAKIRIKDPNFTWRDGTDYVEEDGIKYVYVDWEIKKANVDLSNVYWRYTDGTKDYKDGAGMVYTRKNGKPVVYWVVLENLPEVVKSSIRYKTNNVIGANAGTDAGTYTTSFEIVDIEDNFEEVYIPDTLKQTIKWSIQRRTLEIPTLEGTYLIFDDESHDLMSLLHLQEGWEEYFTITVMYASDFLGFHTYEGFIAHGAGAYRFIFNIIPGINKNVDNPCVVWLTGTLPEPGETPDPGEETPDSGNEGEETPDAGESGEEAAAIFVLNEEAVSIEPVAVVTAEPVEQVEVKEITVEEIVVTADKSDTSITVVQQICDRIKELTYGAQIQTNSFRKYLR